MDAAARAEILTRYADHVRRFEEVASRFRSDAEVVPVVGASRQHGEMLTSREQEMLRLVAEGLTNREIGQRLSISEETVKVHVPQCLRATAGTLPPWHGRLSSRHSTVWLTATVSRPDRCGPASLAR